MSETLAEYLDRNFKQRNLKPADVAELSGLSASYISRLLKGEKKNLTVETIAILVESLGLNAIELFTVAYGKPVEVRQGIDPNLLIDMFQKLVLNPDLIDLIQGLSRLPAKQQKTIIDTVKVLSVKAQKKKKKR